MNSNSQVVQDEAMYKINGFLGSNASVEKSDPAFVNNCDGSNVVTQQVEIPVQESTATNIPTTNIDTIKNSTSDNEPNILKEGINIIKTEKTINIEFNTPMNGKASVTVLNGNNRSSFCKNMTFSRGSNSLNNCIQNLKPGNYTMKVVFNKKTYLEKFSIAQ